MKAVISFLRVFLSLWITVNAAHSSQQSDTLVFVIMDAGGSGPRPVEDLSSSISSQAAQLDMPCVVYKTSRDWLGTGSWTYFPLLEWINSKHGKSKYWLVFIGSWAKVRVARLVKLLHAQKSSKLVFLGRGVHDSEETIIHHFARVDSSRPFLYPDVRAGMVLSGSLIKRLAKKWTGARVKIGSEMNIDAPYEFAKFVNSEGVNLTPDPAFCVKDEDHCAILYSPPSCGKAVDVSKIHYAIKSCEKYHSERLPVLHSTWLKHATNYAIYSDVEDSSYGTVSLGVPNTERGHCGKTLAIIHHAAQLDGMQWLVIADDDTLISVEAMSEFLGCHDHTQLVALGERYGYAAAMPHGYDYITGGGGMVFSRPLVEALSGPGVCQCPTNDTPDDMFLGMCLRSLGVPITHSSAFHQARPMDYPPEILEEERPVSFHKFWMVDPRQVYAQWLHSPTTTTTSTSTHSQDEL
ncbi:beta-1,3-glucosyltransferase-like [Eriocheir sinensis]|uniref:beta-1,3-glucosyltransferase-like n=1 Tax=Eriocheir sinensis TaxID=95602 RepID=UPI0021C7826F|nr:beta-1,3-glucosyltransferase-like [Eriocheir sinensis]